MARLINNDRSEDALDKLAKKMFGPKTDIKNIDAAKRKDMETFLTKINYANNWTYQKSGGKVKALDMQKGFLNLTNDDFLAATGMKKEDITKLLGVDGLYINKGEHLNIFQNNKVFGFLNSNANDKDKQKFLEDMLTRKGSDQVWNNSYAQKIFGKSYLGLSLSEKKEWDEIQNQFNKFSEWIESQRNIFGDKVDNPAFKIQMFLQFKKQGIEGFKAVNVDQNDKSFLLIKNIYQKNQSLNKGYRLTDKRYMGRLERLNDRMQNLQKRWNKSLPGRVIKFLKNWQEIIAEKTVAMISKLLAKLAGITAATLGPLAALGPMIQALAEKAIKKGLEYASSFIKAIYKLDFEDLDKMLQEDFKKMVQLLLISFSCLLIIFTPVIFLLTIVYSVANPVDNTRTYFDGYGVENLPTSGEPDPRVFGCDAMCGGIGECKEHYGRDTFTPGVGIGGFYYNQLDPMWAQVTIGESEETIASVGCLVTSVAMVYNFFGQPLTPADVAGQTYRYIGANMSLDKTVEGTTMEYKDASDAGMIEFFNQHPGGIMIVGLLVNPDGGSTQHYAIISGYNPSKNDFVLYDPVRGPDACLKAEYPTTPVFAAWGYYSEDGAMCVRGSENGEPYNINCPNDVDDKCTNRPPQSSSDIANLALDIACGLKPGFDCNYNYPDSSVMEPKYSHAGNVITDPGGYAFLWDQNIYDRYMANEISSSELHKYGVALFWCTWLPTKVYNDLRGEQYGSAWYPPGKLSLSADTMCRQFQTGDLGFRWITENPEPGDIVCFDWQETGDDYDHVGIVYDVVKDNQGKVHEVLTVESNSGRVYNHYTESGGKFFSIMGFGTLRP